MRIMNFILKIRTILRSKKMVKDEKFSGLSRQYGRRGITSRWWSWGWLLTSTDRRNIFILHREPAQPTHSTYQQATFLEPSLDFYFHHYSRNRFACATSPVSLALTFTLLWTKRRMRFLLQSWKRNRAPNLFPDSLLFTRPKNLINFSSSMRSKK